MVDFVRTLIHRSSAAILSVSLFLLPSAVASSPNTINTKKSDPLTTRREKALDSLSENFYIIGPGDKISLIVRNVDDFNLELEVMSDGTVSIPLIGSVELAGLTIQQASLWITDLLSAELILPEVLITVVKPRPLQISIIGQIERPGLYTLSPAGGSSSGVSEGVFGAQLGLPTLVTAIQQAGGITQLADITNVKVQRRLPGKSEHFKLAKFNLYKLMFEGRQSQNPFLFDGDIIVVPKAQVNPSESVELSTLNISPSNIRVNVIGEVSNPGLINLLANTPLSQAVLAAGGPKEWRANRSKVDLIRLNRNGTITKSSYRLNLSAGVSEKENPPLRDGDVIRIRKNLLATSTDVIDGVSKPLTGLVTIWSLVELVNGNRSN